MGVQYRTSLKAAIRTYSPSLQPIFYLHITLKFVLKNIPFLQVVLSKRLFPLDFQTKVHIHLLFPTQGSYIRLSFNGHLFTH
jgi:hypothetical protein